jgi:hypothetical protein
MSGATKVIPDAEIIQKQIQDAVFGSIHKMVEHQLTSIYDDRNPLIRCIKNAIEQNADKIQTLMADSIQSALDSAVLNAQVKEEVNRRLAKILISKMEGEIEKRANELRADSAFRARLTIAITDVVKGIKP